VRADRAEGRNGRGNREGKWERKRGRERGKRSDKSKKGQRVSERERQRAKERMRRREGAGSNKSNTRGRDGTGNGLGENWRQREKSVKTIHSRNVDKDRKRISSHMAKDAKKKPTDPKRSSKHKSSFLPFFLTEIFLILMYFGMKNSPDAASISPN
jgi:hypothetical protein